MSEPSPKVEVVACSCICACNRHILLLDSRLTLCSTIIDKYQLNYKELQ